MPIPPRDQIKHDLVSILQRDGSLLTTDVYEKLASLWGMTEVEMQYKRSGASLYRNEIRWARQDLVIAGIIERPSISGRGMWRLVKIHMVSPEDYDNENASLYEGALRRISVNAYERNPKARQKCLEKYGYTCAACNFNFESYYGEVGRECIHVHHLVEISTIGEKYKINPIKDLIPVCPNCHYVIHRRRPSYTIEEVRAMIRCK